MENTSSVKFSFLILTILLLLASFSFAQEKSLVDSLEKALVNSKDTTRAQILYELGMEYFNSNPTLALKNAKEAEEIFTKSKKQERLSATYSLIGKIHKNNGEYDKALTYQLQSLRINESLQNKKAIATSYNDIGIIYKILKQHDKALSYYQKSLEICREIKFNRGIINGLNNIGTVYNEKNELDKALYYYEESLKISREVNNQNGIANALSNIGELYGKMNNETKALEYFKQALEIDKQSDNKYGQIFSLVNIGGAYNKLNNYTEAIKFYKEALELAKELDAKPLIENCYESLSKAYERMGEHSKALTYHQQLFALHKEILSEEGSKQIAEMQEKYNSEKKDQEIQLLNKSKELQNEELKRQRIVSYSIAAGLLLVLALSIIIYKSYSQKKKANLALNEAYTEIEEKNKDITDSINYASRIQTAILPSIETIKSALPDSFIFYQPKDIVSGDFYYFEEVTKDNKKFHVIAAVDCTGHGVPGAFMSMIGTEILNKITQEKKIMNPAEILNQLHDGIRKALKQDQTDSKTMDGMDIALCSICLEDTTVEYAGALRNLYMIQGGTLTEIKADKQSIGGARSDVQKIFTKHNFTNCKNTSFYIFSDGFADQFGGADGKKFMTKRLKDVLVTNNNLPMSEQGKQLAFSFESWKGKMQQVDDVLVIGFKI